MAKQKLQKGLSSLFGEGLEEALDDIQNGRNNDYKNHKIDLKIEDIRPNPYQPRKVFKQEKINELAESIKIHGVFQPILVRKSKQHGYELVAGERRLRASKKAKLDVIPAIIIEFDETQMIEISILENIQREDLSIIEEAIGYQKLLNNLNYTQEELAKRVGKSRVHITNTLRLLRLPATIQDLVQQERLQMGHVRPLLSLDNENDMYDVAMIILEKDLSVREVEKLIKNFKSSNHEVTQVKKDPKLVYVEDLMKSYLQTKVEISKSKITIGYSDVEELNRILELINCVDKGTN